MKLRAWIPLFALTLFSLPLTADTVIEEIVARINNNIVSRSEFQQSREQVLTELKQRHGAQAEQMFAIQEKDVLRDLIDQLLLVQRGKDLGINPDTEVIKRLDDMRKQMGLETLEDLEKAAEQQGVSYEAVKENIRDNLITQKVIGQEVGSKILITQEEARQYYEDHQKELARPEQVRLSEILVAIGAPGAQDAAADPAAAAEQKARELREQIAQGASFEEVARKNSSGGSAEQGGDLGYFERGKLAKELEDMTFSMQVNEVSDVIRTKQGYILLKVTEHQQAGVAPFKEIENRIQEALYYQKLQPAMRTYLTKLREEAYIDIKQGYVDTGASPNQTKPIMTAATTEEEKKKKKKKLLIF